MNRLKIVTKYFQELLTSYYTNQHLRDNIVYGGKRIKQWMNISEYHDSGLYAAVGLIHFLKHRNKPQDMETNRFALNTERNLCMQQLKNYFFFYFNTLKQDFHLEIFFYTGYWGLAPLYPPPHTLQKFNFALGINIKLILRLLLIGRNGLFYILCSTLFYLVLFHVVLFFSILFYSVL